ncbi:MAG: MBL fold metallo-hydrolase [Lachnospiraceae bacterium]|nr:MBL fold metallo-hydrolase [Lachnospiraceae bacterium]
MNLKITTLIENLPDKDGKLKFEHGFSAYIEDDGMRVLFDTGQTGVFTENAKHLGIELSETDAVVLSHGHYDHTGGVPALLSIIKEETAIYAGKEFFLPKYKYLEDGTWKYNGNPFEKQQLPELHYISDDVTKLSENLYLLKNFARINSFETINPKYFVKTVTGFEQDLFPDEIALGIKTEQGLVLLVGCSHVGIVNILEHVKKHLKLPVAAVIGGTHLVEAGEERLSKTVEAFKAHGVNTIAVSHCTGEAGMELLQKEFPAGFVLNTTGNVMEF